MCLTIKTKLAETAKEDIVCYKILVKVNGFKFFCTPFYHFIMEPGKTYKNEDKPDVFWCKNYGFGDVFGGFFHTYQNPEDAIYEANYLFFRGMSEVSEVVVIKGIIPKGSNYYLGESLIFNDKCASYASDTLILTDSIVHKK